MGRKIVFISLVGIMVSGLLLSGCVSPQSSPVVSTPAAPSCAQTNSEAADANSPLERQILATTVRLELESWFIDSPESGFLANGHATFKDGRYLVTHNHYSIPFSILLEPGQRPAITRIAIYQADGELITETSLTSLSISLVEEQTLVFDVGKVVGSQLTAAGVESAQFASWTSLPLQPGMEVAQVDWDGCRAHVDWVTVEEVVTDEGTPRLQLANYIQVGASGGAVFWNGYHIGNNWERVDRHNESQSYVHRFSVAALNSLGVVSVEKDEPSQDGALTVNGLTS